MDYKHKPPFPYFGGKSRIAKLVWPRFGDPKNYVEPFFGSGAMLFGRPESTHRIPIETVNDKDGYVTNFWRAVQMDPDAVAYWVDWPIHELDLHARHRWILENLREDPEFYDPKLAGWWCWGTCAAIGNNLARKTPMHSLPNLGNSQGVCRHLKKLDPNAERPLRDWMRAMCTRLRYVRVCSGDWKRFTGKSVTTMFGITAMFLDPPYSHTIGRDNKVYRCEAFITNEVLEYCLAKQDDPKMRIALCGYEGEYDLPGWDCVAWKADGGYSNRGGPSKNRGRERIWFSPHCLPIDL